ncbi:hypothetical protein GCM10020358_81910 [Amorphoplanes nipponensis]
MGTGRHGDPGRRAVPDEADGVVDQLAEHLADQLGVGGDHRQVADVDAGAFAAGAVEVAGDHAQGEPARVDRLELEGGVVRGGVGLQVVHHRQHAGGAAGDAVEEAARGRVELRTGVLQQQLGEAGDGVQRGVQVVGRGHGEAGQLRLALAQPLLGRRGALPQLLLRGRAPVQAGPLLGEVVPVPLQLGALPVEFGAVRVQVASPPGGGPPGPGLGPPAAQVGDQQQRPRTVR